jgi:hypothetical protein
MSKLITTDLLTTLEEYDAIMRFQSPHLLPSQNGILAKKKIAFLVASAKEDEVLLILPDGFLDSAVLAGLTEKNIEHIAKHAPKEYKENILSSLKNQERIAEILEIAKTMDNDLGTNINKNQERINNVIQYIKDNLKVFEF